MPVILLWGHPHVIRHCRWWLVADAYAALAAKGPIRFPGSGLFLPRRTASAPLHCQPAALIAITSNMPEAHRHPAMRSNQETSAQSPLLPTDTSQRAAAAETHERELTGTHALGLGCFKESMRRLSCVV